MSKETKKLSNIIHTGRRMLNTCPPVLSCGTYHPIWTDEEAPADVFCIATINTYAVDPNECKKFTHEVQVMRCSLDTEYDLIYRFIGEYRSSCARAFCGMN